MKIILLITNFGIGGAQRVFYDHVSHFSTFCMVNEVVFNINDDDRIYNSGAHIHSLNVGSGYTLIGKINKFISRVYRFRKIVYAIKPDISISHMDGANWVNACTITPEKKIFVVHGTVLHDKRQHSFINYLRRKLFIPFLYRRACAVVAVSEGIKFELEKYCGLKNVISIPNYFNVTSINNLANAGLPDGFADLFSANTQILTTSGRFASQKNHISIAPLFQIVKKRFPDLKLILLGDGELKQKIIESFQVYGFKVYLNDQFLPFSTDYDVYITGYVQNPFSFIKKSTLFIFPSLWEGFPLALCEAMICGVPVLSSDCPTGPREILSPGSFDSEYILTKAEFTEYGVLLPMSDKSSFINEWVDTIILLLENESIRNKMSSAASQHIAKYDKSAVMNKWDNLLKVV
jgi:glycosyltransferase involved in cell wall biosynthesis